MVQDESNSLILPEEWQEKFLIKRIDEENIEITLAQRNEILESLSNGDRFIQIGKYTLMLNSIKSIDPLYEPDNMPPRPKDDWYYSNGQNVNGNLEAQEKWDKFKALRESQDVKKLHS